MKNILALKFQTNYLQHLNDRNVNTSAMKNILPKEKLKLSAT